MRFRSFWFGAVLVAMLGSPFVGATPACAADEPDLFSRLDANGDGFITKDEVDADKQALLDRLLRTSDADKNGKLNRQEFTAGTTNARPARDAAPTDQARPAQRTFDPEQLFNRIDQNGDGKIVREELPERLRSGFDKADADKSGEVTREEFRASFQDLVRRIQPAPQRPKTAPANPEQAAGRAREIFKRLDANEDGKVTLDEAPVERRENFKRMLDRVGADGMTLEQFTRIIAARQQRQSGKRPAARPQIDSARVLQRIFQEDKNGDGFISRAEAPERMAQFFDRLDANNDGKLGKDELKAHAERIVERIRSGKAPARKRPADKQPSKSDDK